MIATLSFSSVRLQRPALLKPLLTLFTVVLLALASVSLPLPKAFATKLPSGLLDYLRDQDSDVKVRFDGLIQYSNGESYVPVFPQGISLQPNPTKVVQTWPQKVRYPDIIQFDNNLFLLRLIPTSTGKLTLPRLIEYPLALKAGLLPEDFILPSNLSIPSELRVILGSLSYGLPQAVPDELPPLSSIESELTGIPERKQAERALYLADLNNAEVVALSPVTYKTDWNLSLNCLPSALQISDDGNKLYAACLGRSEVVVVDTQANLISNRIRVEGNPTHLWYFPKDEKLISAGRFEKQLTVISTKQNLRETTIPLPEAISAMTGRREKQVVYLASSKGKQIHEVDVQGERVLRTLNAKNKLDYLTDISAMWVEEQPYKLGYLWVVSRRQNRVQVIDLLTEQVILNEEVGQKPQGIWPGGDGLVYVLCADGDRVEVFDRRSKLKIEPILLPVGSFASSMVLDSTKTMALIASAGTEKLMMLDLRSRTINSITDLPYRALDLTLYSGEKEPLYLDTLNPEQAEGTETTTTSTSADSLYQDERSTSPSQEPVSIIDPPKEEASAQKTKEEALDGETDISKKSRRPRLPFLNHSKKEQDGSPRQEASSLDQPESERRSQTEPAPAPLQPQSDREPQPLVPSNDPLPPQSEPAPQKGWWPFARRGQS